MECRHASLDRVNKAVVTSTTRGALTATEVHDSSRETGQDSCSLNIAYVRDILSEILLTGGALEGIDVLGHFVKEENC